MYIYRIYNLSDQCYIGSTSDLKRRWQYHKNDYKKWKLGKTNKCASYELFDKYGIGNCFYGLLETVEEESQLKIRERYWIEFYEESIVNERRPVITQDERKERDKEYYKNNREQIAKQRKEYYENNREQILKQKKEYCENNREQIAKQKKEKYTCECGSTLRKSDKLRHERSIKHQSFLRSK